MLLSELIYNYRMENSLSQRAFAAKCGLTNGYVSMLEKNANPTTGKPITPTIENLTKLANAMDMSVHHLLEIIEDMPVSISTDNDPDVLPQDAFSFARLYTSLSPEGKQLIDQTMEFAIKHFSN